MPLAAMHASYCYACLSLLCMPPTAIYAFYCHACLLLPCMPLIAMHAFYCHACLLLSCMPLTVMHVRTFRHWQLFFYVMSTVLLRCPFLPILLLPYIFYCRISLTAMHAFYCYVCLLLSCMSFIAVHVKTVPILITFFLCSLTYPYSVKN
jgi:hypothetical protein